MKEINFTFFLFLCINLLYAQKQANNWYFGNNAGITFATNPPTMLTGGQIDTQEGCSSISDNNGNLLFYTDGVTVWNSTHAVMQNGTGLLGNSTTTQSALILLAPGSTTLYYIVTPPPAVCSCPIAYSIVDMNMSSGLGAVTVKNVFLPNNCTEKVTAVYHQNGIDIWIIAHGYPNNNFYAFLLTSAGINPTPITSSAGNSITTPPLSQGYMKASPYGNKVALADNNDPLLTSTLELFDFDDSTGIISNALQLGQWITLQGIYGVEFSPDNSKLYASIVNSPIILQYDLLAGTPAAIIASMDTVGISTRYFTALQTGPDGRIYISKYGSDSLACIAYPNIQGNLCSYIENYISLGTANCYSGLPNYLSSIFYNISSGVNSITHEQSISIFPNPTDGIISVALNRSKKLTVLNLHGKILMEKNISSVSSGEVNLDISFLSSGIYYIKIDSEVMKFVKK